MLTKSCGSYDLIVPHRYSVPLGPISTILPPCFASTRIALAGAPPIADTVNLPSGHQLSISFRNTLNALSWLQGTSMVLMIGSSITFSFWVSRSEEHTSELQSRLHLVCRLLLEKKKK